MTELDLTRQFRVALYTIEKNVAGVSDEESTTPPASGGSSLNWVVGHTLSSRNKLFEILGLDPVWTDARQELYSRASDGTPEAEKAVPMSELLDVLARSQETLVTALETTTEEKWNEPLEEPGAPLGRTVHDAAVFFAFHEAYHAGQTGVLRRATGKARRRRRPGRDSDDEEGEDLIEGMLATTSRGR